MDKIEKSQFQKRIFNGDCKTERLSNLLLWSTKRKKKCKKRLSESGQFNIILQPLSQFVPLNELII